MVPQDNSLKPAPYLIPVHAEHFHILEIETNLPINAITHLTHPPFSREGFLNSPIYSNLVAHYRIASNNIRGGDYYGSYIT